MTTNEEFPKCALVKWLKDLEAPDPFMEELRKLIGAERGWATLLSEPMLRRLRDVRAGKSDLAGLGEWLDGETAEGRTHVAIFKPKTPGEGETR